MKQWAALEIGYRIPKRPSRVVSLLLYLFFCPLLKLYSQQDENGGEGHSSALPEPEAFDYSRPSKRIRFGEQDVDTPTLDIKPLGQTHRTPSSSKILIPLSPVAVVESRPTKPTKEDLAAIIAAATAASTPAAKPASTTSNGHDDASKKSNNDSSIKSKANREKRLLKLVGAVVVKCMSNYQSQMDHEVFKKHAKQVINFSDIGALILTVYHRLHI
jgi:[histone H3]-lysine36 N-trimethyltransferase